MVPVPNAAKAIREAHPVIHRLLSLSTVLENSLTSVDNSTDWARTTGGIEEILQALPSVMLILIRRVVEVIIKTASFAVRATDSLDVPNIAKETADLAFIIEDFPRRDQTPVFAGEPV
jgi:hypothetical protein